MSTLPTLLIVDDEVRSLETLRRILEDDFDVNTASTVAEAEQVLQREWVQIIVAMEGWSRALRPKVPFCNHGGMPDEAQGCGMIEAARGSLGHWLKTKKGRILNYQIIAPTTWNFSPRDATGMPGALEQALIDAPVHAGEKDPVSVQHIVRSFDPCMGIPIANRFSQWFAPPRQLFQTLLYLLRPCSRACPMTALRLLAIAGYSSSSRLVIGQAECTLHPGNLSAMGICTVH